MSSSNCCFLTHIQVSQETGKVVWYSHIFQNFSVFFMIHTVKSFSVVIEAEADVFLEFPCFLNDPTNVGSEKEKEFQKNITFCFTDCAKVLTVWITTNCGEFLKRWEYQTPLPASWETCMQVMKQQLEPDLKQRTGSKSVKEYVKAVYCHPAYLIYMLVHHSKCLAEWSREKYQ